jgi:mono/diheme cytochrome c family protein
MSGRIPAVAFTAATALLALAAVQTALAGRRGAGGDGQTASPRSVWEGVYTDEQAKRGQTTYREECARCHADTLAGGESSPPLAGDSFLESWDGMTMGDLFLRTRQSMPQDSPGRLSGREYANILALVLKTNGMAAGASELTADVDALKLIRIDKQKPPAAR